MSGKNKGRLKSNESVTWFSLITMYGGIQSVRGCMSIKQVGGRKER